MTFVRYAPVLLAALALSACDKANDGTPSSAAPGSIAAVAAPAGTTWAQTVVATEQGIRMGNPDAPIKIVEYASYTCPHCREFQEQSHEALERDYVNTGKVSLELRSLIRDPLDLSAALIARCAGPDAFFALSGQLFANQDAMVQQFLSHSQADQTAASQAAPEQRFGRMAEMAGLIEFAKQRGLPEDKVRACLADTAQAQKLASVTEAVLKEYPAFPGTPSFIMNGQLLDNTSNWTALQAKLRDAGA